ncbi:sialidase family protein [Membranihabitans marinus]|uniref:sialidase family protein n=1 Tax=Membranihabitans marinus TaxID=1227546 RepID=UPI001F163CA3|nr:sialidase family protein [Membranihabitans marinus]
MNIRGIFSTAVFLCSFFVNQVQAQVIHGVEGKVTSNGIWIPAFAQEISNMKMGPFIHLDNGNILTIEGQKSLISTDNGTSWEEYKMFEDNEPFKVSNEGTLINTSNGTVILAFMNLAEKKNWNWDAKISDSPGAILPTYVIRSLDGGKTWQDLQKLHNEWTGANRDIIETTSGNVVFTSMMMRHNPGRHTVLTYTSRDDGRSWERSNILDMGGIGHHGGLTESTIEQLKDGRIWQLIRTNWGSFWEAYSSDEGITWEDLKPTSIDASSAPGILKRLSSGRLVLIWNRLYPQGKDYYPLRGGDRQWSEVKSSNHREELSIAFSEDEGKTWTEPQVIAKSYAHQNEDSGKTWLSYPYCFELSPGVLWLTTMQGGLRMQLNEKDLITE